VNENFLIGQTIISENVNQLSADKMQALGYYMLPGMDCSYRPGTGRQAVTIHSQAIHPCMSQLNPHIPRKKIVRTARCNESLKIVRTARCNESLPLLAELTHEQVSLLFHLPLRTAAAELGVCATVLKKRCRKLGIARWPCRKVNSRKMVEGKQPEIPPKVAPQMAPPEITLQQPSLAKSAELPEINVVEKKQCTPTLPGKDVPLQHYGRCAVFRGWKNPARSRDHSMPNGTSQLVIEEVSPVSMVVENAPAPVKTVLPRPPFAPAPAPAPQAAVDAAAKEKREEEEEPVQKRKRKVDQVASCPVCRCTVLNKYGSCYNCQKKKYFDGDVKLS
jgi:hypothetical protein